MRWNRLRLLAALLAIICAGQPLLDYAWGCRWLRARRSYCCCVDCNPCEPVGCGSAGKQAVGSGAGGSDNNNNNSGSIYDLPEIAQVPAEVPELMIPPEVQALLDQDNLEVNPTGVSLAIKSQTNLRTWTLRDGRTTSALLHSINNDAVVLEKAGRLYHLAIAQLSKKDQAFLASQFFRTASVQTQEQEIRVWTHRDGRTLRAKLLEVSPELVRLKKEDRVYDVSRRDLSEADQTYLQTLNSVAGVFDRELR